MLKFTIILVLLIIIVANRKMLYKRLKAKYELKHYVIPYYGGVGNFWSLVLTPDEYNRGYMFSFGKTFKRIECQTGPSDLVSPSQAFGIIYWIDSYFKTSPNGAKFSRKTEVHVDRNGTHIIWHFDKSPYKHGMTASTKRELLELLWSTFKYCLADKWPTKYSQINPNQEPSVIAYQRQLISRINDHIRREGWMDFDGSIRYDVLE